MAKLFPKIFQEQIKKTGGMRKEFNTLPPYSLESLVIKLQEQLPAHGG